MTLEIGYDLFSAASPMGTDTGMSGNFQINTAKALPYKLQVKRVSDSYYWNATTEAWVASAAAEAHEITVPGSNSVNPSAVRQLLVKLPNELIDGLTAAGVTVTAYASGDTPSTEGVDITLTYIP